MLGKLLAVTSFGSSKTDKGNKENTRQRRPVIGDPVIAEMNIDDPKLAPPKLFYRQPQREIQSAPELLAPPTIGNPSPLRQNSTPSDLSLIHI